MRLLPTLALASLVLFASVAGASDETGTALYFHERQSGSDPFATRMLVTPHYLRIDDGKEGGDFILFDRLAHAIYSVSHDDHTVLVVRQQPVTLELPQLEHRVRRDARHYPSIDGKTVVHYELFTNERRCYDVYAVAGLLPEAVAALREFDQTMAGEQAASLSIRPKEMRDVCEMANDVFLPGREYAYGFPVRQSDSAGNARELVNYRQGQTFSASLFVLPANFRRFSPSGMRSGGG